VTKSKDAGNAEKRAWNVLPIYFNAISIIEIVALIITPIVSFNNKL